MIPQELRGPFYGRGYAQISADIREHGVVSLIEHTLTAIDQANPSLNAFVYLDSDEVRAQARALDALEESQRGLLHGIPIAVKDLMQVSGAPLTGGSRVLGPEPSAADAEGVRRLRAAGAVIVGMTLTHEFAYSPTGDVSAQGAAHNPHDLSRMTGGSSAGSGASVASGLVPIALGTDTGGSIRVPAALCGCVGLKGAHGAVPVDGVLPLSPSMDHLGPLAGTVELAALAHQVLSGTAVSPQMPQSWAWLALDEVPHLDARVVEHIRAAATQLAGDAMPELNPGDWAQMRAAAATVMGYEAYRSHADQLDARKSDYGTQIWERLDAGREIPDEAYAAAQQSAATLRRELIDSIGPGTVVLSPSVGVTAPPIGERERRSDGAPTRAVLTYLSVLWNLVGFPSMSVPVGEVDGLPVGLQLTVIPGEEAILLGAAAATERLQNPADPA